MTENTEMIETATVRLTMDVTYNLNGETATEMANRLIRMCERGVGEGMLTGETDAEVEGYLISAVNQTESSEIKDAIKKALEALLNVPMVGQKYDQQHSDTHMSAYLQLKNAFKDSNL